MRIEIVAIGDEILKGMISNTNATFMSRALYEKGYQVTQHRVLSDELQVLKEGLEVALKHSDLVITTGGLGSTLDDHTRRIVAELFNSEFHLDQRVREDLHHRFGSQLLSLTDQATIPCKADPLLNTIGTAPGLVFKRGKTVLILLPGVPHEMQVMFTEQVLPLIQSTFPLLKKREFVPMHFCLLAESQVDPSLRELKEQFPLVEVGIYPAFGAVTVQLSSENRKQLNSFCQELKQRFAQHLFPSSSGKIAEAILQWFKEHDKRLALAESCTGGMIASLLTAIPGSSSYFLGSFVTYCDALKMNVLNVAPTVLQQEGAVSESTVRAMLQGVFARSAADFAIAVSGIAGPDGGSEEKPVGTVWAAIGQRGQLPEVGRLHLKGDRQKIILSSSNYLLGALWRKIAYGAPAFLK